MRNIAMLETMTNLDFDIFIFKEKAQNNELVIMMEYVFIKYDLFDECDFSNKKFNKFFT